MTKEKVLNQTTLIVEAPSNIIYRAYAPFLRESVSGWHTEGNRRYKIVEGAMLVDRRAIQEQMGWTDQEASDEFTTFWNVRGLLSDVTNVCFDFRHNNISTGAKGLRSWVVDDYEIQLDDKILKVPARMIQIKVYEDSRIRLKGKNGETIDDGSLLESLENGRIFTLSVQFSPKTQSTSRKSGLTVFESYYTPYISFLDVAQGVPDAGKLTLRSFLNEEKIINQNRMLIDEIKKAIANGEITTEDLKSLLSMESESEDENENEIIKDTPPTETPEPDQNGDGEISDEEMRSYVKDLKRAFGDNPAMVNDKIEEIKRQIEVISNPMKKEEAPAENTEAKPPIEVTRSQEEEKSDEDKEIERLRSLNLIQNLENIPEVKESKVVNVARQFGDEEEGVKEENKEVEVKLTYKEKVMLNQIYNN